MRYLRGHVERADDDGDGPIRFVAATEGRKADGIDLRMDTVDLTRFRQNPVILWAHDYWDTPPVGRSVGDEVDGDRLLIDVEFDRDDPLGASLDRKYRSGFMQAVSVGFDVHNLDKETGVPERWDLLELSAVPVGLDPDALKEAERGGLLAVRSLLHRERQRLSDDPLPPLDDDRGDTPVCPDCGERTLPPRCGHCEEQRGTSDTPRRDAAVERLLDAATRT